MITDSESRASRGALESDRVERESVNPTRGTHHAYTAGALSRYATHWPRLFLYSRGANDHHLQVLFFLHAHSHGGGSFLQTLCDAPLHPALPFSTQESGGVCVCVFKNCDTPSRTLAHPLALLRLCTRTRTRLCARRCCARAVSCSCV